MDVLQCTSISGMKRDRDIQVWFCLRKDPSSSVYNLTERKTEEVKNIRSKFQLSRVLYRP